MLYCTAKPKFIKVTVYCQIYFILIKDFDWRLIDHALKRLPILLPNINLLNMKGNTKEWVGWQLLQYCCEVRLAPNHALYVTSIWIANVQLVYVGLAQARPNYYVWYVRHPRAAIYNVQQLAIYSGGRMKKLLRSPVPRA